MVQKGKEGYPLIFQKGNQIRDPEVALSNIAGGKVGSPSWETDPILLQPV